MTQTETDIKTVEDCLSQLIHGDFNADVPDDLAMILEASRAFQRLKESLSTKPADGFRQQIQGFPDLLKEYDTLVEQGKIKEGNR